MEQDYVNVICPNCGKEISELGYTDKVYGKCYLTVQDSKPKAIEHEDLDSCGEGLDYYCPECWNPIGEIELKVAPK